MIRKDLCAKNLLFDYGSEQTDKVSTAKIAKNKYSSFDENNKENYVIFNI